MTEDEARSWIGDRYGPRCIQLLERYAAALLAANQTQNLIAKGSEPQLWTRHLLDSAQLERFAPDADTWLDIGSGAGLPGIVLAIIADCPMLLVEPRRKRAEFLAAMIEDLGLAQTNIRQANVERISGFQIAAVTARAYAPLSKVFETARHLTTLSTIWVLPKGRSANAEVEVARESWQGVFHVEQSLSDPEAGIVVATNVRAAA